MKIFLVFSEYELLIFFKAYSIVSIGVYVGWGNWLGGGRGDYNIWIGMGAGSQTKKH